jgi:hypothetical protein
MYGWSKWGGATMGMVKEELDSWYCQTCGEEQTKNLPSYMFPIDLFERDYVRICARCKAKARTNRVKLFEELRKIIRYI